MKDIKWPVGTHPSKKRDFLRYQFECDRVDKFMSKSRKEKHEETIDNLNNGNVVIDANGLLQE